MPKSPSSLGQGVLRPRANRTKKAPSTFTRRAAPRSLIFHLIGAGIGRTAAIASLSWCSTFGIETDFSMAQLAERGECDKKTISNAMPALLAAGFVVRVSPHRFHGLKAQGNRSAIYRFTLEFYALLAKGRKASPRREKFPTPLVFSLPICKVPTNKQHQHTDQTHTPHAMTRLNGTEKTPQESVEASVGTTVEDCVELDEATQTLIEVARLDQAGALVVARALPVGCSAEMVRHLIQAAQAVVFRRGRGVRDPKAYLHRLLTTGDPEIFRTARQLYEDSQAAATAAKVLGADTVWAQASLSFRALPGAVEAVQNCLRAQRELDALPATHHSRLFFSDRLAEATGALVNLAARAVGAGEPPQSIPDRWAWWQHHQSISGGARALMANATPQAFCGGLCEHLWRRRSNGGRKTGRGRLQLLLTSR